MANFLQTRRGKKLINYINGFGASIVIIGAMFKILHFPGGSVVIGIGLTVEAFIFFLSAFDSVHEELEWAKVYPELKGDEPKKISEKDALSVNLSDKLDAILAEANLDVKKLESLEKGLSDFSAITSKVSDIVVSQDVAQKYVNRLNDSVEHMESLNTIYVEQIEQRKAQLEVNKKIFQDMNVALEINKQLHLEMQKMLQNLNTINSVYDGMIKAMNINIK